MIVSYDILPEQHVEFHFSEQGEVRFTITLAPKLTALSRYDITDDPDRDLLESMSISIAKAMHRENIATSAITNVLQEVYDTVADAICNNLGEDN